MVSANLGEQLGQAREKRQLTLKQVECEIKIREDLLQEFEYNNFNFDFPSIYRRGFLKTYVQFLGLNAEKFLAQIDSVEDGDDEAKVEPRVSAKASKKVKIEEPPEHFDEEDDSEVEEESPPDRRRDIWKKIVEKARDRRWQTYGAVLLFVLIGGFFIFRPSPGLDL